jgi:hypothetical protein
MDMQIQFLIEVLPSGLLHPLTLANNPTTYTYYPLPKKEEEIATSYIGDIRNDASLFFGEDYIPNILGATIYDATEYGAICYCICTVLSHDTMQIVKF